jgi:hypothetical protein
MKVRQAASVMATMLLLLMAMPSESRTAPRNVKLTEPAKLYSPDAAGQLAVALARIARREADRGDIPAAIEAMQLAANAMAQQRNTNFELWDNLAELYCAQAKRERDPSRAAAARANGLALLREFRCAAKFYQANTPNACFIEGTTLPNTDMTPLCYSVLCTAAPQAPASPHEKDLTMWERQSAERRVEPLETDYSFYADYKRDAANLGAIEATCRR